MSLTRRDFLQSAALSAASFATPIRALATSQGEQPEPLRAMHYDSVQITGGPLAEQYEAIRAHYLALSNDSLLKVYRQNAGLPAPGSDMGGWYDLNGFVPGHSLGQYISGLARMGATPHGDACRQKAIDLVEGFAQTLGPKNKSILRPDTNLWICYTLDKHFAGLIDAATLAGYTPAKELLNRVLDGAQPLLPAQGRDRIGKKDPPYDETFVMPENLFLAADITHNPAFHSLAIRYLLDRELFDPLGRGDDPFPGQHAYSHAIALSSGARAYLALGEPKYLDAIRNAFGLLTTTQQFASGGWGPNETFVTPHRGELFNSLSTTVDHFETPCGSYAATKLARYLLQTGTPSSSAHGDNLERVLFNAILAVRPPDSDGDYPYYSTYSANAQKVYYARKWPCCSGTLVQTVSDYPINVYFKSQDGLYVNLYAPSRVGFVQNGAAVELRQETSYPAEDDISLMVNPKQPVAFTLYLRIPAWVSSTAKVTINGNAVGPPPAGKFLALKRTWRSGDQIHLTLPQDFRMEPIDDKHPETVALMRGPLQYVALAPSPDRSPDPLKLPADLKQIAPESYAASEAGRTLVLVPLYRVRNESYTSYFSKA